MTYHTYNTECLILGSTHSGEDSRYLTLLTRDLGLVRAVGKSLRTAHSKLRYHLQDFSHARVDLVRGKEVWRITGAQSFTNFYSKLGGAPEKCLLMLRSCSLLSRLLQGEEVVLKELFDLVLCGMTFLEKTSLDTEFLRDFEYMFVIRILSELGYVGENSELKTLFSPASFSLEALSRVSPYRKDAARAINQALEASGL